MSYFYRTYATHTDSVLIFAKPRPEAFLRLSLLIVPLIILSSTAQAKMIKTLEEECVRPESVRLIGATGSCRVVVVPKAVESKGTCIGTFMGTLPCVINYISASGVAALSLTCGTDAKNPSFNQEFMAEVVGFNVATILSRADGKNSVIESKRIYTSISSRMVEVLLSQQASETKGTIIITTDGSKYELTHVTCF